jgi:hypothetical protein
MQTARVPTEPRNRKQKNVAQLTERKKNTFRNDKLRFVDRSPEPLASIYHDAHVRFARCCGQGKSVLSVEKTCLGRYGQPARQAYVFVEVD